MLMGALAAGILGYAVSLPAALHIPLCVAAAFLGGALWAAVPALLRVCRRVTDMDLRPTHVSLAHPRCASSRELESFLGCQIDFAAGPLLAYSLGPLDLMIQAGVAGLMLKAPADVQSITIWAGSQAAEANYYGNLRPHHILVTFDSGKAKPVELQDVFGPQTINVSGHVDTFVRFTIVDTYPSQKTALNGSPFDDCAISEIQLNGTP